MPWVTRLLAEIRALAEARTPLLGVCFGHQAIAKALGGDVAKNPRGTQASRKEFACPLPLARRPAVPAPRSLLYHHNDVVTRMPPAPCVARSLGGTAGNPCHGMLVATAPAPAAPHIVTWQGHPEFETPTGRMCLAGIIDQARQRAKESQGVVEVQAALAKATAAEEQAVLDFRTMSRGTDSVEIARESLLFLWNSRPGR